MQAGAAQAGRRETQFILPEKSFGAIDIAFEQAGELSRLAFDSESSGQVAPPLFSKRAGCYQVTYEANPLQVKVSWELTGAALLQKIQITNVSDKELRLLDVGYRFHSHTKFKFGSSVADKVIGHHFISGHGSHLLFARCDGDGPYLLVLPQDGTMLEYFDVEQVEDGAYIAYPLSAEAVKKAGDSRMPTPGTSLVLTAGKSITHTFKYLWTQDNDDARRLIAENGLIDIDVAPGLTVPVGSVVSLSAKSSWSDLELVLPEGAELLSRQDNISSVETQKSCIPYMFKLRLSQLGENELIFRYDKNRRWMKVTFFVTQDIKTLIQKRGAFIAKRQHTDSSLWYHGLLAEWNNRTGALLGPDNYDDIGGWRIYAVTCDDPGLSKPAFLSGKLAEYPEESQVAALDLYVENFIWGGLQCTENEAYPYAIYGIPDWKKNRDSEDAGLGGKLHIWRIYDYPHIALMYYNMYRIAKNYPSMPLTHNALTYLRRARDTAIAMFTVPMDLSRWDARNTGLYNELCYEDIIHALKAEGLSFDRLERHWVRKCRYFVMECTDLYGSEYPFDTTGFETTHALAKYALKTAESTIKENPYPLPMTREQAARFMETQMACNIACRGVLEPAYYWYGSDYRSRNTAYTLSYMSQMGGWAILDYALYYADDPFRLLRLGYGSILSSWALMNTGYWFPGDEHDGAASGGFEPLAKSKTWLGQELNGGPWYYSCEIDLGFCGALRGAAAIVAQDPEFGLIGYGASISGNQITCEDGINRRFHIIMPQGRLHVLIDKGQFSDSFTIEDNRLVFKVDPCGSVGDTVVSIVSDGFGAVRVGESKAEDGKELAVILSCENGIQEIIVTCDKALI